MWYLDKSVTTIGFAASKTDTINNKLYQCLQGGIIDAVCALSRRILFRFLPFNAYNHATFFYLILMPFQLLPFLLQYFVALHYLWSYVVLSCISLCGWLKSTGLGIYVFVRNHLQIQWIVPLASETSLWSWPGMSVDAGGSTAVTLGALNSLEDGMGLSGDPYLGMGACQEGYEAVIELQQGQETCRCRGRIVSCRGRERHWLLSLAFSGALLPGALVFGTKSLHQPSERENYPAIRRVRGDGIRKEKEIETKYSKRGPLKTFAYLLSSAP